MITFHLRRFTSPVIIDLVDDFARASGTTGGHPRPFGGVSYSIPARLVGTVRTAIDPPIAPVIVRNPSGFDLLYGSTRPTSSHRGRLAPGAYVLRVDAPYYQSAEIALTIPDIPGPAVKPSPTFLKPGVSYPFPDGATLLRGRFATVDGAGVAGVVVAVVGQPNGPGFVTDETGQWVLAFPDGTASGPVNLTLTPPNAASQPLSATIVAGAETVLRATGFRGMAVEFDGRPASGATIAVSLLAPKTSSGLDGAWTYLLPANQAALTLTVSATSADGRHAASETAEVVPKTLQNVPTFRFPKP